MRTDGQYFLLPSYTYGQCTKLTAEFVRNASEAEILKHLSELIGISISHLFVDNPNYYAMHIPKQEPIFINIIGPSNKPQRHG